MTYKQQTLASSVSGEYPLPGSQRVSLHGGKGEGGVVLSGVSFIM